MPSRHRHRRCATCADSGLTYRNGEPLACSCPAGLQQNLADIPALAHDLEMQMARQGVLGERGGSRAADVPLPFDGTAGRVLTAMWWLLAGWVGELSTREVLTGASIPSLSAWLLRQFPRLADYPAVDELTADVARIVNRARRVIDRPADRIYLGPCKTRGCVEIGSDRKERPTSLYADPDAATVTCWQCHDERDVEELRSELLALAADMLASATECSRALTSLGEPVTKDRIWKWAERGRLVPRGVDGDKHPLYRVGDVQDLLVAARLRAQERQAG